jgi:hypothetical protein
MGKEKPMAEYTYLKRIKIQMIVIILLLACLIPVAIADGGKYDVAALVLLIASGFAFMTWQDSSGRILIYADRLVQEKGAGPFRRILTIRWRDGGRLKDDTSMFTFGRSYFFQDNQDRPVRIRINSTLGRYEEILESVVKRCSGLEINQRTRTSLAKLGIKSAKSPDNET